MNFSPMVAEFAAAYEHEHDRKPAERVLQIAEHIQKTGKMFTELGQKDAQEGKKPYPADVFPGFVRKSFRNIHKDATVKEIADLWQSDYMDGYNSL